MIVTINTDASFSKTHQIGSFAFWIVSNEFRIKQAGLLRKKVKRPEIAEFRCIINALHILFKKDCSKVTRIIVNTDCLNVIHLVKNDKHAIARYGLKGDGFPELVKTFKSLKSGSKIPLVPIELRHVKAHTSNSDARSYVNDWCDKNAKEALMKKVNEFEKIFTYLLADNGGVSHWETRKLYPIGIKFEHEYGSYEVRNYLDDNGDQVKQRSKITQVYCERV